MSERATILLVSASAGDRDLALLLLRDQLPRLSVVAAVDPLTLAEALRHEPAIAVVSLHVTWAHVTDVIGYIRRRRPDTAIVISGKASDALVHIRDGIAIDGVVHTDAAGYLTLASLMTDILIRRRGERRQHARNTSHSGLAREGRDRMIGSLNTSASEHRPFVVEPSPMSDIPSYEMRASEPQSVPVDGLSPTVHDTPPPPVREGLPPTFRMRADAHYVESLDTAPPGLKLQLVDVNRIDPREARRVQPAPELVASIRSVGVLQPLIAEPRNGRFRLLAGDKRLAAARAAGLRDVPCIVRRADDDSTEVMAAANLFVVDDKRVRDAESAAAPASGADAAVTDATRELTKALSSLTHSLPLLERPASSLARATVLNVLKAEIRRATWLVEAQAVLRGEMPPARRRVPAERLVTRALEAVESERSLRGIALNRQGTIVHGELEGNEDRLVCALSGVMMATMEIVEGDAPSVDVAARVDAGRSLVFTVTQSSAPVPPAWADRTDAPGALSPAAGVGGAALAVARRIVDACEGRLTVRPVEYGSEIQIVLPLLS